MSDYTVIYFATVSQNYGGVEQKIIAQYDALINLKQKATLYLVCSIAPDGLFKTEISKRPGIKVLINSSSTLVSHLYRRKEKFIMMSDALRKHDPKYSIVYLRYPIADYYFFKFLESNKQYKIVSEHNRIERYKLHENFFFYENLCFSVFETVYGRKVRNRISAFVGVTQEITDFEINESRIKNKHSATIGNGISVNKYPVRKFRNEQPETIKLLFVGSGYRTHGLDRLIKGLAASLNKSLLHQKRTR